MTQNNELEKRCAQLTAALKGLLEYEQILQNHGFGYIGRFQAAKKLLAKVEQSPISPNEQQEVVPIYQVYVEADGWMDFTKSQYEGFASWVHKRILYTSPPKQAIPEESAWLIEKYINGKLHYAYCDEIGILDWTSDSLAAMRFSRKQDAAQLTSIMEDADRVAEHMWAAPTNTEVGE